MEPSFAAVVGYGRLQGERASQQLGEVYQALRLYVNGFQPSMKLLAKEYDGRKVRRIYDAAKTPLQRLLLSHLLPASKEHELQRVAQVLDPLRLFYHLQDLQQALLGFSTSVSCAMEGTSSVTILPFCVNRCLGTSGTPSSETREGARQDQMIHAIIPDPVSSHQSKQEGNRPALSPRREACPSAVVPAQQPGEECVSSSQPIVGEQETMRLPTTTNAAAQSRSMLSEEPLPIPPACTSHHSPRQKPSERFIEQAIQDYLEDQRSHHRRPKTLQWHEIALGLFQCYLFTEHQGIQLDQITQAQVRGWLAWLPQLPTATGALRSPNTVESYARSARAFCRWLVHHRYLQATPFAHLDLPAVENRLPRLLEPGEWEQLLLACHPPKETGELADQAAARNRAILWVLFDTGMHISEACRLRLGDVDREQGMLRVRGKGSAARWLTLEDEGRYHLLAYLDAYRLKEATRFERGDVRSKPLFLSQTGRPLTKSGIALLFGRLRKRAGITRKGVNASLLRESFAVRYLQAGGDLSTLWELLGQKESGTFEHSVRMRHEGVDNEKQRGVERVIDGEPLAGVVTR